MLGTGVTMMINDGTLRALGEKLPDVTEAPEDVLERLIRFVAAGMQAPYQPNGRQVLPQGLEQIQP